MWARAARSGEPHWCPLLSTSCGTWLAERKGSESQPLFPTITGRSTQRRDAIEHRIANYAAIAAEHCPSMRTKHVTAHTLRHSCAMRLLASGVDVTLIALWLGHDQVSTTNIYLHADMTHKGDSHRSIQPAFHHSWTLPGTGPG